MLQLEKGIQDFITSTLITYKNQPERIDADRHNEDESKKDYEGRELLELLQNADDQSADEISFDLDIKNLTLTISNTGKPFSLEGYKSILLQNNSSKKSEEYIGNKGKGFRSILTWADEITITSNNINLIFSDEISQSILKENISSDIYQNKQSAFLAFCKIEKTGNEKNNKWATQITIKCNQNYLTNIKNQLDDILKTECLLEFLNNIKTLSINDKTVHKNTNDYTTFIDINESFPLDDNLIESTDIYKKYQIKGLISDKIDFSKEPLYSYLPTSIYLNIPILLHVTFDLDSSRKRINNSIKNKFIFDKVIDYIKENIIKYTEEECSWNPYYLLLYKNKNIDIENTFSFYSKLDNLKQELKIIPCIDGKYRKIDDAIFVNNDASNFMEQLCRHKQITLPEEFLHIAKRIPDHIPDIYNNNKLSMSAFSELSEALPGINNEIEIRASLIRLFVKEIEESLINKDWKNSSEGTLLIDNNSQIIEYNHEIFTHRPSNTTYELPSYTNITFLHNKLYEVLINKFDCQDRKARQLKQYLDKISQINEYEAIPLIEHLISDTIKNTEKDTKNSISNIKEMIKSIYSIWDESMEGTIRSKVPIITNDSQIKYTDSVFFNSTYKVGKITEFIWSEYIQNNNEYHFILNLKNWGDSYEEEKFSKFLAWLGVKNSFGDEYLYENSDKIFNTLSLTQIVLLSKLQPSICLKEELKDKINNICKIENYVLDCNNMPFINIDYKLDFDRLNKDFNLSRRDAQDLLLCLGAKQKIEDLSIDAIRDIITDKLEKYEPEGSYAQNLYTLLIEKNIEQKKNTNSKNNYKIGNCRLYSKNKGGYFPNSKLYYYDNKTIPTKFIEQYPIIDLPKRRGEKQVSDIFGINTFKDINFKVKSEKFQKSLTDEFKEYIKSLSSLFLAYSAVDASDKEKKINENRKELDKIEYKLCSEISLLCNNDIYPQKMQDFEFINITDDKKEKNTYYLKVPENIKSLEALNTNYKIEMGEFISEVIAIAFKLTDGERFASIYKDEDIEYSERKFKENYPSKILDSAKRENKPSAKYCFWQRIYDLKKADIGKTFDVWYKENFARWDLDYEKYYGENSENILACLEDFDITNPKLFFEGLEDINFSEYNMEIYRKKYEQIYDEKIFPILWQKSLGNKIKMLEFEDKATQLQWRNISSELLKFPTIRINDYEDNHKDKIWKFLSTKNINENDAVTKNKDEIYKIRQINEVKYESYLYEINDSCNHSLLFFEETLYLEEYCKTIPKPQDITAENSELSDNNEIKLLEEIKSTNKYFNCANNKEKKEKASHYSPLGDKKKNTIGMKNQKRAKITLEAKNDYIKVEDALSDSDGYDLRCCTKENDYHYYEVKTFDGNGFFMSCREYDTYKKLKPAYKIFLVFPDDKYTIIENIEEECNSSTDNYRMTIKQITTKEIVNQA